MLIVSIDALFVWDKDFSYQSKSPHKTGTLIGREKNAPAEPIIEALHQLLMSYPRLKRRRDKIQSLLQCLVKPESMSTIEFVR